MKKHLRQSVCNMNMIIACAVFVIAAILGTVKTTAKAYTGTKTLDFRNGREYSFDNPYSENYEWYYIIGILLGDAFDNEFKQDTDNHIYTYEVTFNENPLQKIICTCGSNYKGSVKAADGCSGDFKFVASKKTFKELYIKKGINEQDAERYALNNMIRLENYFDNSSDNNLITDGSSEYTFIFKFGTAPREEKTVTFDFRDGKELSFDADEDTDYNKALTIYYVGYLYDYEYRYDEVNQKEITNFIFNKNPYQAIIFEVGEDYQGTAKAAEGCTGECKITVSKEFFAKKYKEKQIYQSDEQCENNAAYAMKEIEYLLGDKEWSEADGSTIYTFILKFGTTPKPEEKPAQEDSNPAENAQNQTETVTTQETPAQLKDEAPTYTAGTAVIYNGLKYEIIDAEGNLKLTGVTSKKVKKISVPATVKYNDADLKVTTIASGAIKGLKKVTAVTIGTNVTTIQKKAISNCPKLKTVTIKSLGLKTVNKNAAFKTAKGFKIKLNKTQKKSYKKLFKKAGLWKYVK